MSDQPSPVRIRPRSLQVNMQADPRAAPRAKSHPHHILTLLYVCTLSTFFIYFFFPIDPDTHILPPESRLSLRLREAHYFTGVPPLFSPTEEEEEEEEEEVGQPGRRAAQGCVQDRSGSTGEANWIHTINAPLNRVSKFLQQITGWFIITRLFPTRNFHLAKFGQLICL